MKVISKVKDIENKNNTYSFLLPQIKDLQKNIH